MKKILLLAAFLAVTFTSSAFAAYSIGKLYTLSNNSTGNAVIIFNRLSDGKLVKLDQVATGGNGLGGGLGNQGAVVLSQDGNFLFAVNAGSKSVSSFRITSKGLKLIATKASGGQVPVSVTENHGRLFVLNAGSSIAPGNIKGFYVLPSGDIWPIPYATQPLSNNTTGTGAAQIAFSSDGRQLIVTEKATNLILTYHLKYHFYPSSPEINASVGNTPFGFAVGKRNNLFVSNAEGGTANISSLSSYRLSISGKLNTISGGISTGETAACWVALTPDARLAFTTNTASGTVSSYQLGFNGSAKLKEGVAGNIGTGSGPIDMSVSPDGRFLYTLNAGNDTLSSFAVTLNGKLSLIDTVSGLPDGANGLAVY